MTIEVRGHTFSFAPIVFVCDSNLYYTYNGKGWSIVIDQYGYSSWGNYQHGCRTRHQSCTSKRDRELNTAFRSALRRATGLAADALDDYIQKHIDAKNQMLVEGTSVRLGTSSTTISASQGHAVTPAAPTPKKERGKRVPVEGPVKATKPAMAVIYMKYGLTEDNMDAFHEWYRKRTGTYNGVKLKDVISLWLALEAAGPEPEPYQEPETVYAEPEAVPETTSEATMTVVASRPDQASFAAAVKENCFGVCVVTGSAIHARCSAAHLVEHSKNGAAHYTNGLWLRWDIHKMMDDNWCAINPDTMAMWFLKEAIEMDPDLGVYHGKILRNTRKPINREFLRDRWARFQKLSTAA